MNKIVAIHQPHYFPWLGYLDKMAKADEFVILDEVQLTDRSPMVRNKFLQIDGTAKYLTVSVAKKGYREKKTNEIELTNWNEVRIKHHRFLELNYGKTPFYKEIMPLVSSIFESDFQYLFDLEMVTIEAMREIYGIETPLILQSTLDYDRNAKNSDLMLNLCKVLGANVYLSGNGARKYMVDERFLECGIEVHYQRFDSPSYAQYRQEEFVSGLSALDLAFQCGIEGARKVFWSNMQHE